VATINAEGVGVRHAIVRALATANLTPADATFRLHDARLDTDRSGRILRASVTMAVHRPRPIGEWSPERLPGLVNPDGAHPLMVRVPADRPFFLDVFAVSWERWLRRREDTLPPFIDPQCPRVGVTHAAAADFASSVGKRLPTEGELRQAWGEARFPWGDDPGATVGRVGAPRFDQLPEVGFHPPDELGLFDLGCWLWQWTAEGTLTGGLKDGGTIHGAAPADGLRPVGFRLAQDG